MPPVKLAQVQTLLTYIGDEPYSFIDGISTTLTENIRGFLQSFSGSFAAATQYLTPTFFAIDCTLIPYNPI